MLRVENLEKVFNKDTVNENKLFDKLNLTVRDGDFITVIGSNGAGKSTLLNLISGSLEEDGGNIFLDGKNIVDLKEYKRSKEIGRVFQNPTLGTCPSMNILENLSLAANKNKKYNLSLAVNKKNEKDFITILKRLNLGLEDKLYTSVGLLSGGQRQALSLLMATMNKPRMLLLDEHTAALDPKTSEIIMDLTDEIVKKDKITTFMVTHNLTHALKYGNRIIMMHRGEVILDLSGREKEKLTIEKLLSYFENTVAKEELSDRILLSN